MPKLVSEGTYNSARLIARMICDISPALTWLIFLSSLYTSVPLASMISSMFFWISTSLSCGGKECAAGWGR